MDSLCAQVYTLPHIFTSCYWEAKKEALQILLSSPVYGPPQMHADECREIQYQALVLCLFVSESKGKEDN